MLKMKNVVSFVLIILTILLVPSCKSKETPPPKLPKNNELKKEEVPEKKDEPIVYNNSSERPIAIMIDNDDTSVLPHYGLDDAYAVYEMYVEGNATRLMALFRGVNTKKIGPVRSARHYFLNYMSEHDAIYVAYGWSPNAYDDIKSMGVNKINGIVSTDDKYFWRDRKFKNDYHSVFTSIENIKKGIEDKKYRNTSDNVFMQYYDKMVVPDSAIVATKIKIPYSKFYSVTYEYDEKNKRYNRIINNSIPHESIDKVPYAPTNIIIQQVKNYSLGDGSLRQEFSSVGSGNAKYISMGKVIDITWTKDSRQGKTTYKDKNGNIIKINPAQIWINLVPPSMNITIE